MGDYTFFLANALAKIGYEVEVLTSVGTVDPELYPLTQGARVHRIVNTWGISGLPEVVRAIKAFQCDVLAIQYTPHAFDRRGITLGVNVLPTLVRLATHIRILVNFHELFIPLGKSPKHWLLGAWQRLMAFVIAVPCHVLTAIDGEWPKLLRKVGVWKSVEVIPVGSNIPRLELDAETRSVVRGQLGADARTLLIGCFGAAGAHRDARMLLSAFRKLEEERPARLVWVGNAGSREPVDNATLRGTSDVVWTGALPHPEVSQIMSACDVFVLPFKGGVSTKRGSLAAALLHELPVLTTRRGSLDAMFAHRDNIYLVPLGDSDALADGLLELGRDSELRRRLARGARALHEARFAWDVLAKRIARSIDL
jgi:glycosyltransferase involved in cell wall biosynthesis